MTWIIQEYEEGVHVVPDTEPGHVLSSECFCSPVQEVQDNDVVLLVHNDRLDRMVAAQHGI